MADVSVEFGAKDTGLENALKTVQDELTRLDEKVKGGELSFNELQSTMKRVAQAEKLQAQLQGMADSTKKAGDAADVAAPKARELGDGMQDAGNKADGAAGIFDSSFAKISAAFTVGNLAAQGFQKIVDLAFDAARAVVQGFSDAIDLGGRLDDLSKRTGETAGKLLVLENAFVEAGVSADQVGTTINKLQNFMVDAANGGEKQKAAMDNLGISLADLAGKTPTEQMGVFASKIAGIEDPSQRAAAASEVFGEKLGGKLLPLLTEFSPALDKSRESVGSLEEVMDENAATFAAAGDTIDRVKGKMAAFAAGIMSETLPALKDLGEGMESVDAAGLGQAIGSQLNPPLQDFVNILSGATDLVKSLGQSQQNLAQENSAFGATYRAVNESLMGFNQMMHDAFTNFTPFGYAMQTLKNRGEELKASQDAATTAIAATGSAAAETKPKLDALPGAGEKLSLEFENLPAVIESSSVAAGDFKTGLEDAAASVAPMKGDFSEISTLTAQLPAQNDAFTQSILETNQELNLQPGIYASIFQGLSEAQAKEEERRLALEQAANKLEASVGLQIQLNNAIASGNIEEQERVQNLINGEAAQKRILQLTEQYIKTGLGEDEAKALAKNLVDSETAAKKLPKPVEEAKIEMAKFNSFVEWLQGEDLGKPVKPLSEKTKEARNEIEAFGKYIGSDFDGVSFPDVAKELGIDTLGMTGSQQIDAILNHIKSELPGAKQNPVDEAAGKASAQAVKSEIESQKPNVQVNPVVDQVQLEDQIGKMQAEITNEFTGGEGGPGGSGGTGGEGGDGGDANADVTSITQILDGWTDIITAIRDRLPMQALA